MHFYSTLQRWSNFQCLQKSSKFLWHKANLVLDFFYLGATLSRAAGPVTRITIWWYLMPSFVLLLISPELASFRHPSLAYQMRGKWENKHLRCSGNLRIYFVFSFGCQIWSTSHATRTKQIANVSLEWKPELKLCSCIKLRARGGIFMRANRFPCSPLARRLDGLVRIWSIEVEYFWLFSAFLFPK